MQDGTFESPGFSAKGTSIFASAVPQSAKKKKKKNGGGGFGKSRMHRETEISKTEFLAAGETHKV